MKKILHFLILVLTSYGYGQTPVYQFNFDGNLNNVGTGTFNGFTTSGAGVATYVNNRFGTPNQAINIPNNLTFLNSGAVNAPNLPDGNSSRTLSFWVKFINDNDNKTYCPVGWGASISNQAFGFWRNGVQNSYYTWGSGNDYNIPQTNTQIQATNNGWVHIAMTHNGSSLVIYYNGVSVGPYARTLATFGPSYLVLNRLVNGASNGTGDAIQLDDLRVYNTALTSTQIQDIYNQTNTTMPSISNVSATNIGNTSATINYTINANNASTTTEVRYAVSPGGTLQTQSGGTVTGTSNTPLSVSLTGLSPNTTYEYNVWAVNSQGTAFLASSLFFTTTNVNPAPVITNVAATNVTFNAATVNFNLNAFGSSTTYVVEFTTDVLAPWQTQNGGTTSVNASTPFQIQLANLNPDESYFVRVKATNATGQVTTSSEIQINTPTPIVLTNVNDSNVTATSAQIDYTLNTNGYSAFVELRYQPGTFFDSDNPFTTVSISNALFNNAATNYNYTITGLTPNTTYSYQFGVVTSNAGGIETGENAAFTTLGVSAQPTAPSPQTFCQTSNSTVANLSATGTNIKWYANATGGSQLSNSTVLSQGIYYVSQTQSGSAESTRLAVQVNITIISPPSNIPANQTFCQSATLGNIQTGAGSNFQWYAAQTGGSVLPNSTSISTGTYYLSQTIGGCESPRTAVSVIVNIVNAPTAQAQTFCQSGTVANLTANGTQLKWYTAQTGGTQLATTTALTTGTYYVSQTNANCESLRTAVSVTVNVVNAPTASAQTFCQSATVANLAANGTNLKWYTTATGGSPLSNVASLSTATYYVSQTVNACESSRTPVSVTIDQIGQPVAQSNQSFCSGATLSDVQFVLGGNLTWYTSATGGSILPSSTVMTSTTYYVTRTVASCESLRTAVSVTVNVVAAPTGNASQSFTQGATVANLLANGTSVVWFASQADASANVNPLASTTLLVNNTTYYAMQTVNSCRSTSPLDVSVSITLGLEEAAPQFNFVIYPNPAQDVVTVALETELKSVEIYSLHGQKVIATTSSEINVSTLPNGVYFVKVQDQNGAVATQKLVIR